MSCKDCGHAISMNKICDKPIQAATDMLKHMAAHKRSRAFAVPEPVMQPELIPAVASSSHAFAAAGRLAEGAPVPILMKWFTSDDRDCK